MTPLAVGAMYMVMIFAGGHISGGHFNPAVTIAVFLRGKCSVSDVPSYILTQFLAAGVAGLVSSTFLMNVGTPIEIGSKVPQCMVGELLGTFALVFVVLNVATAKDTMGNSFYGLAIGLCWTAGSFAMNSISGGLFNPAAALGNSVAGLNHFSDIWIYIIGQIIGAAAAAYVFLYINGKD